MQLLYELFNMIMGLYRFVLIVAVILSWLVAFNVLNSYNPVVETLQRITYGLTEPFLRHIRRYVPPVSGLDLSFIVLYIAVYVVQRGMNLYVFEPMLNAGFR